MLPVNCQRLIIYFRSVGKCYTHQKLKYATYEVEIPRKSSLRH